MTRLEQLFDDFGQSPWLDNLTRAYLRDASWELVIADVGDACTVLRPTFDASRVDTEVDQRLDALSDAHEVMPRLDAAGIGVDGVGLALEEQGVASFHQSFQDVLAELGTNARQLAIR